VHILETLSIGYLKNEAALYPEEPDFKRLDFIRNIGIVNIVTTLVFTSYMGSIVLENFFLGIFLGLVFSILYFNFYLVLLSTIRKSDFLNQKTVLNEEREVRIHGVKLKGDGKKQPEKFDAHNYRLSFILRLLFLGIFSSCIAIGGVLLFHHNLGIEAENTYKNQLSNYYNRFIDSTFNQKNSIKLNHLKKLEAQSILLQHNVDSLTKMQTIQPDDEGLVEDLQWAIDDFNAFNKDHQIEMESIKSEIDSSGVLIEAKKSAFLASLQNKSFFTQRIGYVFKKSRILATSIFILCVFLSYLPFYLRYKMIRSTNFTLDSRLEDETQTLVLSRYALFQKHLEKAIDEKDNSNWLKNNHYKKWPVAGDAFENPPFNTIKKIDKRTILRKGSLETYLLNRYE
jgi:hypothetical protein